MYLLILLFLFLFRTLLRKLSQEGLKAHGGWGRRRSLLLSETAHATPNVVLARVLVKTSRHMRNLVKFGDFSNSNFLYITT